MYKVAIPRPEDGHPSLLSLVMMWTLLICVLWAAGITVSASPTSRRFSSRGDELSNADTFVRGLPPKSPLRRFNPSSIHSAPKARASDTDRSVIIQATPTPGQGNRKRDVYDQYAYVYWDSTNSVFKMTTALASATKFTIAMPTMLVESRSCRSRTRTAGLTHQQSMNDDGYAGTSLYFTSCSNAASGPSAEYGAASQSWIWTTPSDLPDWPGLTYHSEDDVAYNPAFYVFEGTSPYTNMLGAGMQETDFGKADATSVYEILYVDASS